MTHLWGLLGTFTLPYEWKAGRRGNATGLGGGNLKEISRVIIQRLEAIDQKHGYVSGRI